MHLYRTLDWGALAQFQILDDRQYRGLPACQTPGLAEAHKRYEDMISPCPELYDARRDMLGVAQNRWLMEKLGSSKAQWNLLTQQTLMTQQARIDPDHPELGKQYSADNWSGFPAARDRIFHRWAEAGTSNPLALGGDIHSFAAADIRDPAKPDGAPIAAEFVGGSITSLFHDPSFKQMAAANRLRFAENEVRGYGRVDLTPSGGEVTFRALANALTEDTTISDIARFTLEAGRAGIRAQA
jgi:alkaline phosphatase D